MYLWASAVWVGICNMNPVSWHLQCRMVYSTYVYLNYVVCLPVIPMEIAWTVFLNLSSRRLTGILDKTGQNRSSLCSVYCTCRQTYVCKMFFPFKLVQKMTKPLYCVFDIEGELDHHKRQEVRTHTHTFFLLWPWVAVKVKVHFYILLFV